MGDVGEPKGSESRQLVLPFSVSCEGRGVVVLACEGCGGDLRPGLDSGERCPACMREVGCG